MSEENLKNRKKVPNERQAGQVGTKGGKPVYKLDNAPIEKRLPKAESAKKVNGKDLVHVNTYLQVKGIRAWNQGGMRAYAIKHRLEYATEKQLNDLFVNY